MGFPAGSVGSSSGGNLLPRGPSRWTKPLRGSPRTARQRNGSAVRTRRRTRRSTAGTCESLKSEAWFSRRQSRRRSARRGNDGSRIVRRAMPFSDASVDGAARAGAQQCVHIRAMRPTVPGAHRSPAGGRQTGSSVAMRRASAIPVSRNGRAARASSIDDLRAACSAGRDAGNDRPSRPIQTHRGLIAQTSSPAGRPAPWPLTAPGSRWG
jgi:hypothetical protein